jgi:hypothetical protein
VSTNSERISQIRSKVHEERALLSELEQKIADEEVKKVLLGPASLRLDQVEGFYLDQKTLDETRSEAAWSRWLDGAERELASAVKRRAQAEETIRMLGPNVKIIG